MKSDDEIVAGLFELESDFRELDGFTAAHAATCQKLDDNSKIVEQCALEMNTIAGSNQRGNIKEVARAARFATRDQGLLLLEAARQLSSQSAKFLSISEKMAALIAEAGQRED